MFLVGCEIPEDRLPTGPLDTWGLGLVGREPNKISHPAREG